MLYNRLDKGEPLGLDSTVIYAEKLKTNTTTPKDRRQHVEVQHLQATRAATRPDLRARQGGAARRRPTRRTGKWMYFVTVDFDTGETKFAETEAEHEKS